MPRLKPSRKFRSRQPHRYSEGASKLLELLEARRTANHCERAIEDALRDAAKKKTDSRQKRVLAICSEIARRYLNSGELPPIEEEFIRQLEAHLKQQILHVAN